MIQRQIYEMIAAGIETVKDDPALLDELFRDNFALEATEVAAVKTHFANTPPNVINGYVRKDTQFPVISIVLAEEVESENFLADSAGQVEDEDSPFLGTDIDSAVWSRTYHLLVYAEHPDICIYDYEVLKYITLAGMRWMTNEKDLFGFRLSGTELAPDPAYLPEYLFGRMLVLTVQREFQRLDYSSRLLKAFRVSGIHVDSSGSSGDVGDVKTLVTPYVEDDDD